MAPQYKHRKKYISQIRELFVFLFIQRFLKATYQKVTKTKTITRALIVQKGATMYIYIDGVFRV